MRDVEHQLQDYWVEITAELPEPSLEAARHERVGDGAVRLIQERRPARRRPVWAVTAAAFAGALLLGGAVTWLLATERGPVPVSDGGPDGGPATTAVPTTVGATTVPGPGDTTPGTLVTTSSAAAPTTTLGAASMTVEGWNPILADTRAREAPPAAACPPATDPDTAGPAEQARPVAITPVGLTAAFDRHAGRIVSVGADGTTWTFDVCTNAWQRMDPDGTPYRDESDLVDAAGNPSGVIGDLVYDVDSDRTVVFGGGYPSYTVFVYDATANTWTAGPLHGLPGNEFTVGAVYDPVSGLIVTTMMADDERWEVWAYDVDTGMWTAVGTLAPDRLTPCCTQIDLLGYSEELDRLVFTTSFPEYFGVGRDDVGVGRFLTWDDVAVTLLLDPRTGAVEIVPTPSPVVDLGWQSHSYGQAGGTVFVNGWPSQDRICGFDAGTMAWARCFGTDSGPRVGAFLGFDAMVDEPINGRLVLINGRYGSFWSKTKPAVWAIDLDSGDVLTLVAPADGS
jgi:hypothetical protein